MPIDWIKSIDNPPPKDGNTYLGLVKGCPCIWQYDDGDWGEEIDLKHKGFWFQWQPAVYEQSEKWTDEIYFLYKLTHWAKIDIPEDYGNE